MVRLHYTQPSFRIVTAKFKTTILLKSKGAVRLRVISLLVFGVTVSTSLIYPVLFAPLAHLVEQSPCKR